MYMFIQGRLQQSARVPPRHSGRRELLDSHPRPMPFHPLPRKHKHPALVSFNIPPVPSSLGRGVQPPTEHRSPTLGKSRDQKRPLIFPSETLTPLVQAKEMLLCTGGVGGRCQLIMSLLFTP